MIDSQRKLLTEKGLGEKWKVSQSVFDGPFLIHNRDVNRTFTDPADYEALREKVILPNLYDFVDFIIVSNEIEALHWFLSLSVERRCETIYAFGTQKLGWKAEKSDLEKRVEEWVKNQPKTEPEPQNMQIASGKRMPWKEK